MRKCINAREDDRLKEDEIISMKKDNTAERTEKVRKNGKHLRHKTKELRNQIQLLQTKQKMKNY